jgi:SET domain-containing protein 6
METFFTWFQSHKGYVDRSAIDIVHFPISEGGRGAIALKDVPVSLVFVMARVIFLN